MLITLLLAYTLMAQSTVTPRTQFLIGEMWPDNNGVHINAYGGGILSHLGRYYWFRINV